MNGTRHPKPAITTPANAAWAQDEFRYRADHPRSTHWPVPIPIGLWYEYGHWLVSLQKCKGRYLIAPSATMMLGRQPSLYRRRQPMDPEVRYKCSMSFSEPLCPPLHPPRTFTQSSVTRDDDIHPFPGSFCDRCIRWTGVSHPQRQVPRGLSGC